MEEGGVIQRIAEIDLQDAGSGEHLKYHLKGLALCTKNSKITSSPSKNHYCGQFMTKKQTNTGDTDPLSRSMLLSWCALWTSYGVPTEEPAKYSYDPSGQIFGALHAFS